MWQQNVTKLLSNLGWGSGFRLPIANEENLALERELEKRQRLIQLKHTELEDSAQHCETLEKGIKNTSDHIAHDKKLIAAKRTEVLAEAELKKFAKREAEKIIRECKVAQETFRKASIRNRELRTELDVRKCDLSELVDMIEYDRQELAKLEKKAEDQDVYLHMLQEVCEDDSETLKKYASKYKAASGDVTSSRIELEREVALTLVTQQELEGLSDRFRKLHKERGEIVDFWKGTLVSLSSRDVEMKNIAEEYTSIKSELKSRDHKLSSEHCKLKNRQNSSGTASIHLSRWDRKVSDLREEIKETNELGQQLQDSVLSYETAITLTSIQIKDLNKKCSEIDKELSEMNKKVEEAQKLIATLTCRLNASKGDAVSVAERLKQISLMVDEEEKKMQILGKQMQKEMIRKSQWAAKKGLLLNKSRDLDHEIKGVETNLVEISNTYKEGEEKLDRRKATIYRIEIQVISLQLKYKPWVNPKQHDSKRYQENEDRVFQLKNILQKLMETKAFAKNQMDHLELVFQRIYKQRFLAQKEILVLEDKFNEQRFYVKFALKNLDQMVDESQNAIVDHSLVNLKLTQLMKALKEEKNMLYDLEHHRLLIQSAAREKKSEIEIHSKLLTLRRRGIKEEVIELKVELNRVVDNISKKKKRYEIVMRLMAKPEDVSDDVQSEAYYVLRMSQEREFLQREGDKWDAKVKEAEIETEALQNSLSVVQCSNELFKDSLKPLEDESYHTELNKLKQIEKETMSRKFKRLNKLHQLQQDVDKKLHDIDVSIHQKSILENKAVDKQYELRVLQGDLNNQALSGKRSRTLTMRLLQGLNFSGPEEKEIVSLDIKLRATRRKIEFGVQALVKLINLYPFMYNTIWKLLNQEFGEEFANKFLKRVSPIQECPSPSSSSTKRRTKPCIEGHGVLKSKSKVENTLTSIV